MLLGLILPIRAIPEFLKFPEAPDYFQHVIYVPHVYSNTALRVVTYDPEVVQRLGCNVVFC